MHRTLAALFCFSAALAGIACTLTEGELQPAQVAIEGAQPGVPSGAALPDGGAPITPACRDNRGCRSGETCVEGACRRFACQGAEGAAGCELEITPPPEEGSCRSDAECPSRVCGEGTCVPATCGDGRKNGAEADTDCGPGCPNTCAVGASCAANADCGAGLYCAQESGRCTSATCQDRVLNGAEIEADCGGGDCPGCDVGSECNGDADCLSGVCAEPGTCAAPACDDEAQNQDETDTDCGGSCGRTCGNGDACAAAADCTSNVCRATGCAADQDLCCQAPACNDGVTNGNEPVTDCGNQRCGLCATGHACTANGQCQTGLCQGGACRAPPCSDGQRNNTETDTDCGGGDAQCARCAVGRTCAVGSDCASGTCTNLRCTACFDGVRNGNETGQDCGGSCGPCAPGIGCALDADCSSGACQDGRCCGGTVVDCTRCARRLAETVGQSCTFAPDAAGVTNCENFLQCLRDNPQTCTVRYASGCSDDPGGVCNNTLFGGNAGAGLVQADRVLGTASCFF